MRIAICAGDPLVKRVLDSRFAGPVAKQMLLLRTASGS
jgi:hypothetical protein